jgi:exosortase/archaeosortase family protein
MLMTFFTLAAGLCLVLRREPVWAKCVLLLAAAPVAVGVNVLRITATGVLYDRSQDGLARWVFHDVAGWLMMPAALAAFFGLLWVAHRVVIAIPPARTAGTPVRTLAPARLGV